MKAAKIYKEKVLATVTHDLQTPLNSIILSVENSNSYD